jgi:phosphoribosylanthranilate isomerase
VNKCDLFLFDSKSQLPGGTGKTFDWKLLKKYKLDKEFFISGGIGLDSISALNRLVDMKLPLYGIDVNSKFEDEFNLKVIEDLIKFKEIIDNEI